jgi:N-acetylmuramoyl-L-alanine amidase
LFSPNVCDHKTIIYQNQFCGSECSCSFIINPIIGYYEGEIINIGGISIKIIQNELKRVVDNTNNREIKPTEDIYVLKGNDIPSVLIECGFLSNEEEELLLQTSKYQEKIIDSIYKGIVNFFQIK